MKISVTKSPGSLGRFLRENGVAMDYLCGGRGTCGRCRVRLLSGEWLCGTRRVVAPGEALACQCFLLSERGEIELENPGVITPESISCTWRGQVPADCDSVVAAVDLGSTTVAAVEVRHGRILRRATGENLQKRCGGDVVTRITHASTPEGLDELRRLAEQSVAEVLGKLRIPRGARVALAGNTVMSLLLHGIDPTPAGVAPFAAPCRKFPVRRDLFGGVELWTAPAVSGYIGGDMLCDLLSVELGGGEMLVDVGTNCEILFHGPEGLVGVSAAAGPAFEGGGISCGMRSERGAVSHFYGEGNFTVLGGVPARGMCGTAAVDFLAWGLKSGRLDRFGRLRPAAERFEIADGVAVTERDVEQLLKAKAALFAGIRVLEEHVRMRSRKIYLAGGFAAQLDLSNAVAIGMLPERDYETVGNASLGGAARLACDPGLMAVLEELSDRVRVLPLNEIAHFNERYCQALMLPGIETTNSPKA